MISTALFDSEYLFKLFTTILKKRRRPCVPQLAQWEGQRGQRYLFS